MRQEGQKGAGVDCSTSITAQLWAGVRSPLGRSIVVVLVVKALTLTGLWLAFVGPRRVQVDAEAMAVRLAGAYPESNRAKEQKP